jgi:glycosyltransferase involved in cell wall biosynthesis
VREPAGAPRGSGTGPAAGMLGAAAATPRRSAPVLLVSGLPLSRESSFSRQLRLLGSALIQRGIASRVCDAGAVGALLHCGSARALLLLGYPDQFPFLSQPDLVAPVFLWAQFSRPPAPGSLGPALPVPLTPTTARFLAGSAALGPVIPHGVDSLLYTPGSAPEKAEARSRLGLGDAFGDAFIVGTVAAHTVRKRFDLMVEAFARLKRRRSDALFLIKTDRSLSLDGGDLGRCASRHGVEDSLRVLLGELAAQSMVELYRAMDVYLNLSEWEGFCIPVLEAMSCGVPVVTHPVQGPGEIVPYRDLIAGGSRAEEDGGVKLLRADPEAVAVVLARAADSPQLLAELGRRGRLEVVERYDVRRVAGLWSELFRDVMQR